MSLGGAASTPRLGIPETPKAKEEDPRRAALRQNELERRRIGVDDLRIPQPSGQSGSVAVPR